MEQKNDGLGIVISLGIGLLGGLIGGALWVGLSFVGKLAFISGTVAGFGGGFGGMITGESKRPVKLILAIVSSLALFSVGIYIGMGVDIYTALSGVVSFGTCVSMIPDFFADAEVSSAFIKDAVIGLLSYAVGAAAGIYKLKDL